MATYFPPKRATEYIFYIGLVSQANTKVMQSSATLAAGDFKVSIDGGALTNLATLPVVTPAASKSIKVVLSIAEMTGDNIMLICSDAAGSEWCDLVINLQTTARQIDDLATPTNITAGTITTVTTLTNLPAITAGWLTATGIAADAITDAKVAADVTIASVTGAVGSVTGAVGSVTGAVGSVTGNVGGNVVGSVASVTAGVTLAASAVQAIWDALTTALTTVGSIGKKLADWTVGTIDTYTGNTKQTGDAFLRLGAPAGASVSVDIAAVKVDTAAILVDTGTTLDVRIPAALVGGRMDASVGAMALNTLTASALATDAVTEIQAGLATPTNITAGTITTVTNLTTNNDKTGYTLSSAGIQAVWDALTSALTPVGSIGKLLVDNINATISSRSTLTEANVRTAVGLASANLDTQLDAIPTVGETADQVWDEILAGHLGAGSTGAALNAAGAAGDPWSTAIPGAYGAGTAGKILGDNVNTTISSRSSHTAADVWAVGSRTLTSFGTLVADIWLNATRTLTAFGFSVTVGTNSDKTGYSLSSAGVQAIWDALLTALTTVGSVGKLLADNLNATISSRSSHTAADVWAVGARTLTSFGTLVTDVWAAATRTLTAFGFSVTVGTNSDKTGYTTTTADKEATADALLGRSIASGVNASGAENRSVGNALRILRNNREVVANVLTVMQEDDVTPAWTAAVTQTAGNPISKIDPT